MKKIILFLLALVFIFTVIFGGVFVYDYLSFDTNALEVSSISINDTKITNSKTGFEYKYFFGLLTKKTNVLYNAPKNSVDLTEKTAKLMLDNTNADVKIEVSFDNQFVFTGDIDTFNNTQIFNQDGKYDIDIA